MALYSVLQYRCPTLEHVHVGVVIVGDRKIIASRFTKSAERIRLFAGVSITDETLAEICETMLATLRSQLLLSDKPEDWQAHYMSSLQWREFYPTLVSEGTIDRIFDGFVAGPMPAVEAERTHEAVQHLIMAMYLYAGYRVQARGPRGCLVDAIELLEPETARRIRDGETKDDWSDLVDREGGGS